MCLNNSQHMEEAVKKAKKTISSRSRRPAQPPRAAPAPPRSPTLDAGQVETIHTVMGLVEQIQASLDEWGADDDTEEVAT